MYILFFDFQKAARIFPCGFCNTFLEAQKNETNKTEEYPIEEDSKGTAPRALYRKFGFVEGELIEEFGYPNQRFILHPSD